ncbi:MAG: type III PLP-dependent enzyme [Luteibacter sp.]
MAPDGARAVEGLRRWQRPAQGPLCAYVYDLDALGRHAAWMKSLLPSRCELFYAAKANAEPPVLHTLCGIVDGFEAASGGELRWLHEHVPDLPLLFGGPGKLDDELTLALSLPDCAIHVESVGELTRLAAIAERARRRVPVFLRMNIDLPAVGATRLMMGGRPSPFGMDEEALPEALERLRASPWLELRGFHFHLMSHQPDVGVHLALVEACLAAVARWKDAHAVEVAVVNVGGGFGVDYADPARSFDWAAFCAGLAGPLQRHPAVTLRFEPGRYVSVACGFYAMEVIDIKRNHGQWFAIGRGGTHHFRTPPAQGHDHPFFVVPRGGQPHITDTTVTLVGQLCTPKDVLAREQPVESLAIGDWLVFPLAGAYAWNISHQNFLMHAPPAMVFLPDGSLPR